MRNRHWWRPNGRFSVNLSLVLGNNLGVVAPIELPRNGEAGKPANLGNSRSLQEIEGVAARANKDKSCENLARRLPHFVSKRNPPEPVPTSADSGHGVRKVNSDAVAFQRLDQK